MRPPLPLAKFPVICLMGPTASGKTDLAMQMVDKYPVEIISVDSVMIYKGMDIGSGKPNSSELLKYPHHLVDILEPCVPYSAGTFYKDVLSIISDIQQRGKVPLLVGGTMLYFNGLFSGIDNLPVSDPLVRAHLQSQIQNFGLESLYQRLVNVDPIAASKINQNDAQRIQRALEVFELTQKPISSFWSHTPPDLPFSIFKVALNMDRAVLHDRIQRRFMLMLEQGLIDETKTLLTLPGMHSDLPSMRSVGYRQVTDYLMSNVSYSDMVNSAVAATRQLAKRQLTWLRRWQDIMWCDAMDADAVTNLDKTIDILIKKIDKKE